MNALGLPNDGYDYGQHLLEMGAALRRPARQGGPHPETARPVALPSDAL